ncbi:MAG: dihydrofolate reductase family protein [Actinomycetes bacterium]
MRRLLPLPVESDLGVDELAAHYAYPDAADAATVRANMVSSVDGAIAVDGRAKPLSGQDDWYLFGLQRALADAILVGAGTARAEGYGAGRARLEFAHLRKQSGQPDAPTLVLVTRSGNLDPDADYLGGSSRAIVITCASGRDNLGAVSDRADLIVAGNDAVDLRAAFGELHDRGHRRLLSEGGPHLLGSLLDAGLIDEMVTTLSPLLAGGNSGRMVAGASTELHDLSLAGVLESEGALFLHYRRKAAPR